MGNLCLSSAGVLFTLTEQPKVKIIIHTDDGLLEGEAKKFADQINGVPSLPTAKAIPALCVVIHPEAGCLLLMERAQQEAVPIRFKPIARQYVYH